MVRDAATLRRLHAATEARLAENERNIQALLASQTDNSRAIQKSGVLSIKNDAGLWKQFLFALYQDGEFSWYRPRSDADSPPEGSIQVANLQQVLALRNPHYLTLTSPLEKVQLWSNSVDEIPAWAQAIAQVRARLEAAREAFHVAVTHDNVEACYAERMSGIQQVKDALAREQFVETETGPVLLTAPSPGPYNRSLAPAPYWGHPSYEGLAYSRRNPDFYPYRHYHSARVDPDELESFAEDIYDNLETERKAFDDAPPPPFAWMEQQQHLADRDAQYLAESLRLARIADRDAQATFDRYENNVADSMASKITEDTGMQVSVMTPRLAMEAPYVPLGSTFEGPLGVSAAQRIMASRGPGA